MAFVCSQVNIFRSLVQLVSGSSLFHSEPWLLQGVSFGKALEYVIGRYAFLVEFGKGH